MEHGVIIGLVGIVLAILVWRFGGYDKLVRMWREKAINNAIAEIKKNNGILASPEFLKWQDALLKKYYGIRFFTNVFGVDYPAHIFSGVASTYPFNGLYDKMELNCNNKTGNHKQTKYYAEYKEIKQPQLLEELPKTDPRRDNLQVRFPQRQGYMLDSLMFDELGRVKHFVAWVGIYANNIYTSHILEHENYRMFEKYKADNLEKHEVFARIKSEMTLRNAIHDAAGNDIQKVLSTGVGRASHIGVQLAVMVRYTDGKYKLLTIKRSQDVAARPGFYQFVPSGGFEVFGNDDGSLSPNDLKAKFSLWHAILREFHEEVKGMVEMEEDNSLATHERIDRLTNQLNIPAMLDHGTAHFEFLGSIVGLVDLRNELSFVLRTDEALFSEQDFLPSYHEAGKKGKIDPIAISSIEQNIRTLERVNEKDKSNFRDATMVNPSSAALYKLLKEHRLYKEAIIMDGHKGAEAWYLLGWHYEKGACGLPIHIEKAKEWYRKAANNGHTQAQVELQRLGEKYDSDA